MSSQYNLKGLTTKKSQEETRLDHLVAVDCGTQRVDQEFEYLALEGMDLVYHVVVGPRELDAHVGSDGGLRCRAASATLLLVSVVRHGECVKVEDEGTIASFSPTNVS